MIKLSATFPAPRSILLTFAPQDHGRVNRYGVMIDWNRIDELKEEIGADDFGEIVEIFLEEVDEGIDALRTGVTAGELESRLHFLKGSALNLGFADFSNLCQRGESAAARGAHAEIDLPAIVACYDQSKVRFMAALNQPDAA